MNNPLYYIGDSQGGSKVEFPGSKEKILFILRWRFQDHEGESGCGMSLRHCLDNETLFGCPLLKNRKVYSCPQGQPTHSLPGMILLVWVAYRGGSGPV